MISRLRNSRNDLGQYSDTKRWTNLAVFCYNRGCKCSDCFYCQRSLDLSERCQVKGSVLNLVKLIGPPVEGKNYSIQYKRRDNIDG